MTWQGKTYEGPSDPAARVLIRCSFCGKSADQVAKIVCGPVPTVAICSECVPLVVEIMAETR